MLKEERDEQYAEGSISFFVRTKREMLKSIKQGGVKGKLRFQ